jgi:putative hydrolase of the HAD superfamily
MKDNQKIKNIILDFGGVIYQISHQKQKETFMGFGIANFDELYSQALQNPLFERFETGSISDDEFREALVEMLPGNIRVTEIDRAWNSILIGFSADAVSLLKKLNNKFNLFLLSNTNAIHYNIYIPEFNAAFGYDFEELFVKAYWSFKVGLRKPGDEIYKYVIEDANLNIDDCLFIDDSIQNIEAAKNCGIKSIWLKPGQKLSDLFDEGLNLTF